MFLYFSRVNDRIISANGISLEGADYGAAIRVLRDSGSTVLLVVKRRASSNTSGSVGNSTLQSHRLTLTRNNKKDGKSNISYLYFLTARMNKNLQYF